MLRICLKSRLLMFPLRNFGTTMGTQGAPNVEMPPRAKKFPSNTILGQMRLAAKEMPHKDFAFFYKQKFRLTLSELDVFFIVF